MGGGGGWLAYIFVNCCLFFHTSVFQSFYPTCAGMHTHTHVHTTRTCTCMGDITPHYYTHTNTTCPPYMYKYTTNTHTHTTPPQTPLQTPQTHTTPPQTHTYTTTNMFLVSSVQCPICGLALSERLINLHLDQCLQKSQGSSSDPWCVVTS